MRSNVFKEARISLYILSLLLFFAGIFYFLASMFTTMGYKAYKNASVSENYVPKKETVIIIDAGHGGEDSGASDNGLFEKDLNLEIALKLESILNTSGYKTVMTRSDDSLLYKQGEENNKKFYDLRNREVIAENYENAIFVSIHINKFPASYCKGLQVFYSSNNAKSKTLATKIQNDIRVLQPQNNRLIKDGNDTIYLMKNLEMPAVLIECGFISNPEEAQLLRSNEYKNSLTLSIYHSITEFLKDNGES